VTFKDLHKRVSALETTMQEHKILKRLHGIPPELEKADFAYQQN